MSSSYQQWISEVTKGKLGGTLQSGELVKSSSGKPFAALEFVQVTKKEFIAEVAKKEPFYIYHFFPSSKYASTFNNKVRQDPVVNGCTFLDVLSDAFIEIFKREDQVVVDWVYEMKAWAIKVSGWTNHIWGDELALRVIERVAEIIEEGK